MRYLKLTKTEKATLEEAHKNHHLAHYRKRCHSLLLSDEGWQVKEIARLYKTRTRTIYEWFNRWEKMGIVGMGILPGRGVKSELSSLSKEEVKEIEKEVELKPQNLDQVCEGLSKKLGIRVSKPMLKNFLKKS